MEAAKKIFTRAHIIWFLLLNFGLVLLAAGIHFFKSPNNFAMGGTSGISIIAATLLPHMDVGTFMFIINGVLIVLGLVFLGRAVIGATLYSSVALSFYVWVLERAVPMARPFTDDTFLELCYAVILPAAGSAIIFNIGASSGGTDIIAMILSKYTSLEIGKALLVSDFCIALFAGGLYGVRTGLYCVLGLLSKASTCAKRSPSCPASRTRSMSSSWARCTAALPYIRPTAPFRAGTSRSSPRC